MDHLDTIVNLIIGGTILAILVAVAFYVLSKLRNARTEKGAEPEELLERFGQFYEDGSLTSEEYKAIRRTFVEAIKSKPIGEEKNAASRELNERLEQLLRAEKKRS